MQAINKNVRRGDVRLSLTSPRDLPRLRWCAAVVASSHRNTSVASDARMVLALTEAIGPRKRNLDLTWRQASAVAHTIEHYGFLRFGSSGEEPSERIFSFYAQACSLLVSCTERHSGPFTIGMYAGERDWTPAMALIADPFAGLEHDQTATSAARLRP